MRCGGVTILCGLRVSRLDYPSFQAYQMEAAMQTVESYRDFFLQPTLPRHRTYEILRARFVDGLPVKEIARRFGSPPQTVQTFIRDFKRAWDRGEGPEFFVQKRRGPKADRKKPKVREQIVRLRARGYADTDIAQALRQAGMPVSVSLIDQVLREEGLIGLRKRSRAERERVKAELA
jgi:transposase